MALLKEKNGEQITNGDIQKLKYTNKVYLQDKIMHTSCYLYH